MRTHRQTAPWWGALVLAILLFSTPAAPAATLRWKLKPGDAFHYLMEQNTVTVPKRNGMELGKITQSFTVDLTRTVKTVADDGSAEMTQRFDRVRMKYDAGLVKVEYDSSKEPDPTTAPLVGALKAMVGAEFSFKMSSRGEMSDVRVPDSVLKAFREAGSRGGAADQFSEEGFKKSLVETSVIFPSEDLGPGRSWSRQMKIRTPEGPQVVQTRTYTYEGPDDKAGKGVEKIGISSKVDLQADPSTPEKPELKSQDCKGALYFDNSAGRMVSSTVSEKSESAVEVMGAKVDLSVDQNTSMKLVPAQAESK
ncbi:MAG: DUF6263 family protein [Isosphaeraceae bacterium]|nr:DUF6263 family protein [Isosphaeraceae bacterium]